MTGGKAQTISMKALPSMEANDGSIKLTAYSDAELPVEFYGNLGLTRTIARRLAYPMRKASHVSKNFGRDRVAGPLRVKKPLTRWLGDSEYYRWYLDNLCKTGD